MVNKGHTSAYDSGLLALLDFYILGYLGCLSDSQGDDTRVFRVY